MTKSLFLFVFIFLKLSCYPQTLENKKKQNSLLGIGVNLGGTLLWDRKSHRLNGDAGLVANIYVEYIKYKYIYKLRLNYTGEFNILGNINPEEQTELAYLIGRFFEKRFFFTELNAGVSYTSAAFRKTIYDTASGENREIHSSYHYFGLAYEAKAGYQFKIGRLRFCPLVLAVQGNCSIRGSYTGITIGSIYRFDLTRK